ncbi:protein eyes shut [Euwallacea similis]|uniref:protein eyes shut n=1 Tax=Euwallacea similis TaxID=1736056 RepID=UPI00344CE0CE
MPRIDNTSLQLGLVLLLLNLPWVQNGFSCLSNPCIHGICLDDLNSTYFCYCIDGYTGLQCQTNWNDCWSSPCQNGGICIDGIASFNCSCPAGFVGELCEEDFNECESNPCWNNATCVDGPNGYVCQCLPGYSGIHCEIDIAVCNSSENARCQNAGVCLEGPGDTFSCRCQPGWEGFLCDIETNECMSAPCQNGAVCIDLQDNYECACLFGYTGRNCEELVKICEKNPCKNAALCLIEEGIAVCYCVPDFHGELCQLQYDECLLGPKCSNGGTCIDGIDNSTCSCPPNLTGALCECLILPNNQLDCNYISPITTTTVTSIEVFTNSTIAVETDFTTPTIFSERTTLESTLTTTASSVVTIVDTATTAVLVPNDTTTTTFSTETAETSTSIPYCITQTLPGITSTIPQTTITTTGVTRITILATKKEPSTEATITESTSTSIAESTTHASSSTVITDTTEKTTTLVPETTTAETPEQTSISTQTSAPVTTIETAVTQDSSSTSSVEAITEPATIITNPEMSSNPSQIPSETTLPTTTTEEHQSTTEIGSNRSFPDVTTSITSNVSDTTTTSEPSTTIIFLTEEPLTHSSFSPAFSTEQTETSLITTAISSIDCTVTDQLCLNGGSCIYAGGGHKCVCPFDAEGDFCETKLGIRNAAFTGNSYLSHLLPQNDNISLEFEAKTLSNQGLLFYTHSSSTYMALYVMDGFLMFKFSCGYQTMLLSELKVPVNNGYSMNVKASLNFSKDLKHCYALIKINDTLTMSGDQMAVRRPFTTMPASLHLGGTPEEKQEVPAGGFVGCMSNLTVSARKVYIYKDAEDGFEISECSSLACLSNPCRNGASCSSQGDSWKCHCKNGFLGTNCDISICNNNPCLFGGTCIPFSNSGYICLCPYGKHGHFCENSLKVSEPYFSSTVRGLSSFAAYPLPEGTSQKMEIKFRFTPSTIEQISLLLFIGQNGQHDFYSDHLAVSFVKGYIMLTWNMGSGPRRIFTSQPIESGARDYLVKLGYDSRRAWLFVENLGNFSGRSPGQSVQLNAAPMLYLGGHDSINFSQLPHDLPLHTGFSGCIFDVEVKVDKVVFPLQSSVHAAFGRAVGQCGTTECYEKSCQNGGACLHHGSTFMCLCQDKWFGPLCSSAMNFCDSNFTQCSDNSQCIPLLMGYECDCPLGKVGQYCEKSENISDISFTGSRSYLSTHPVQVDSGKFNVEMEIRMLKDSGIVLLLGTSEASFVCLNLQNGLLELRLRSGKPRSKVRELLTVRSSRLLLKGIWHKVQFGVFGRKVYLYVDHVINMGVLDHGFTVNMPIGSVYLGGLPDMSHLPFGASSSLPVHYTGCLRHFSIDEKQIYLMEENILSSRNVIDCDGTPCGGEVCLHGGTCWLDSLLNAHCSCLAPYYGERCEFAPKCSAKNCKNGHCSDNSTCACHVGFEGGFCETQIQVKSPSFMGKSYLIVQKLGDKRRGIKDSSLEINQLYLNFTTIKDHGLLLWTRSRDQKDFLGLGLESGHLKVAFSLKNQQLVEVVPSYRLSDGLWHAIELILQPFSLRMDSKRLDLFNNNTSTFISDGNFFIGGLSGNSSFVAETNGLFPQSFEGCIEAFSANDERIIRDFTPFEGVNIANCKIT